MSIRKSPKCSDEEEEEEDGVEFSHGRFAPETQSGIVCSKGNASKRLRLGS